VNAALLSRTRVFTLEPLRAEEIDEILRTALSDEERGLGGSVRCGEEEREWIVRFSEGDARRALSLLELAAQAAPTVTIGLLGSAAQRKALLYDKSGEEHYNLISALHKSLRGSNPDAALYWAARMLDSGEDPLYILRRLVRFAVEDIGLADPRALTIALGATETYRMLGSPEGELAIAEAVIYLAVAPKSNALYKAFGAVRKEIRENVNPPVPLHLRNAPTRLMKELGFGKGYAYDPSDGEGGLSQEHFPEGLEESRFYFPSDEGLESKIRSRLEEWRRRRAEAKRKK
jgi:putative ATPase